MKLSLLSELFNSIIAAANLPSHSPGQMDSAPTVSSPSSILEIDRHLQGHDEPKLLAVASLLSSHSLHLTQSRQSFGSNTDLLPKRVNRSTLEAHAPQTARSEVQLFEGSTQPSHLDYHFDADPGRPHHRAPLRRQGTDDFLTSVVTYEPSQPQNSTIGHDTSEDTIANGYKHSHDSKVESDSNRRDEGYGLAGNPGHGQLNTLRKARGWRRVSDWRFSAS